jgi:hypothetical protein
MKTSEENFKNTIKRYSWRERGRERITAIAQYFRRKQENGMKKHKETDVNFERGHS